MPVRFMLVALAAMLLPGSAYGAEEPRSVAEAFCKARVADDEPATLRLVTTSLAAAIEHAKARSDVIAKAAPGEKPPFGDGIPYQAFADIAGICDVGETSEKAGVIEVEVKYRFPETSNADWTDRLKLATEDGRLLVDDILFADVANGEPDQGLRRALFEAFDQ